MAPSDAQSEKLANSEAECHGLDTLVHCYWREIAAPAGLVKISAVEYPALFGCRFAERRPFVAKIDMPHVKVSVIAPLDRISPVGIQDVDQFWLLRGQRCEPLTWSVFAELLLAEISALYGQQPAAGMLEQMRQSVDVTAMILKTRPPLIANLSEPVQAYVQSEQALVYGHPFHPMPKARSGLRGADLMAYSPEVGATFALHYFAAKRTTVVQDSLLTAAAEDLVASEGPKHLLPGSAWVLVPVHPWQAAYLQTLPVVQKALVSGESLRYLGAYGPAFAPTASVRTLFAASSLFFYKTALSVGITNSVRRNDVADMAASLRISRILRALKPELREHFPNFHPLEEQAYLSVELPGASADERRLVSAGFGLLLRENIERHRAPGEVCQVAAALFGNGSRGRRLLRQLLHRAAAKAPDLAPREVAKLWFESYVEQLMGPMLYLYMQAGVMFAPHLQNVVAGFVDGWPVAVYLRDFEKARLVAKRMAPQVVETLTADECSALLYPEEQAWQRFSYNLFTNHMTEAVRQLSFGQADLEGELWDLVREQGALFLARFPGGECACLQGLLDGQAFPAKTNMITQFSAGTDAAASYVPVGNPWRQPAAKSEAKPEALWSLGRVL